MGRVQQNLLILLAAASPLLLYASGNSPVFFPDDPIQVMPPPAPVVKVTVHKIDQPFDFISNSVQWKPRPHVPSGAVNTLGVPPDSAWFTNRHGMHRMTREELQRGATGEPPVAPFTIVGGKTEGITPGFRMEDAKGRLYFVKVDPLDNPEMATAADVITSRFLYAIGYNVPENYIVRMRSSDMRLSDKAQITSETVRARKMTSDDLQEIVKAIPHFSDGSFRVMASLKVEGEAVGPFYYLGKRSDDPNDLVPHENRRDLRALFVFFAWLNNTDARSGNTYDVIVHEGGVSFIRHYLIDFGSSLGSNGDSPKDPRLGHAFMIATPREAMRSIFTLGFLPHAWERIDYPRIPAIGNFTSSGFDPENWKTDYPNQAFLSRSVEDEFWAAEQVMAFTSDDIREIVETAEFSDSLASEYMTNTLAERRDIIGRTYFAKVLPIDNFRVENGELRFDDLAVQHEFQRARQYEIRWSHFDNMTGRRTLISSTPSSHLPVEAERAAVGAYFSAVITLPVDKLKSVIVTIRKTDTGYRVVGCSRSQNGSI
jgi:hypothetical protein